MAQTYFLTRVELHKAKWPNEYDTLHKEMAALGFHREITRNGKLYWLPTAEYIYVDQQGSKTAAQVLALAKTAANKTQKTSTIVTVKSADWADDNLTEKK
jgi:hypothetical protein